MTWFFGILAIIFLSLLVRERKLRARDFQSVINAQFEHVLDGRVIAVALHDFRLKKELAYNKFRSRESAAGQWPRTQRDHLNPTPEALLGEARRELDEAHRNYDQFVGLAFLAGRGRYLKNV